MNKYYKKYYSFNASDWASFFGYENTEYYQFCKTLEISRNQNLLFDALLQKKDNLDFKFINLMHTIDKGSFQEIQNYSEELYKDLDQIQNKILGSEFLLVELVYAFLERKNCDYLLDTYGIRFLNCISKLYLQFLWNLLEPILMHDYASRPIEEIKILYDPNVNLDKFLSQVYSLPSISNEPEYVSLNNINMNADNCLKTALLENKISPDDLTTRLKMISFSKNVFDVKSGLIIEQASILLDLNEIKVELLESPNLSIDLLRNFLVAIESRKNEGIKQQLIKIKQRHLFKKNSFKSELDRVSYLKKRILEINNFDLLKIFLKDCYLVLSI